MTDREKILKAVSANQPERSAIPEMNFSISTPDNLSEKFTEILTNIGGHVVKTGNYQDIIEYIKLHTTGPQRVISTIAQLSAVAEKPGSDSLPHELQDVELAIIGAHFGIAENGAVWVTEQLLPQRVLPFVCQHLVIVLAIDNIVATMHDAYEKIADSQYGFGTFIAGPSKTADIEQSLVLGAHGSRSMIVFLMTGE
ncbi:LutC/YkgG family protein [Mucilaginibacter xinganensis]|uniref:Lactate utilization protein B/C n=1 Tax=Mucilaginibacter xinganensis TaxID=1234841 RepID=A0A223P3L8_9SPHI|nr:LUD domain-containing protein [Mucilaginibacter xinganensis]ASU36729.1 lactate utilization protein B/C [Mucilaginibacter xinganensis]